MSRQAQTPPTLRWLCLSLLLAVAPASAGTGTAGQSLDQAANDPTASLMAVQIQNLYAEAYHGLCDESANAVLPPPVVPFQTGSLKHIARATTHWDKGFWTNSVSQT